MKDGFTNLTAEASALFGKILGICDYDGYTPDEKVANIREAIYKDCLGKDVPEAFGSALRTTECATGTASSDTPVSHEPLVLPKWCTPGQYCVRVYEDDTPETIAEECTVFRVIIATENRVVLKAVDNEDDEDAFSVEYEDFVDCYKPVRFRAPTFDEAQNLLRRRLRYNDNGTERVELISRISKKGNDIYINDYLYLYWERIKATVGDGYPLGIVEIDTEKENMK